jgi:hypothetical protein
MPTRQVVAGFEPTTVDNRETSPANITLGRSDYVVERDDRHLAAAVTAGFADCVCDPSIQ